MIDSQRVSKQDLDAGITGWRLCAHALVVMPMAMIGGWLESLTLVYSLFWPAKSFAVIAKD